MQSIFTDKNIVPEIEDVETTLADTFQAWETIKDYVKQQYPEAIEEWNYSGNKYGWSFRLKDKKRVIVYLLPRDEFFKVALVFGQKAFDKIMDSSVNEDIKTELKSAKVYAEGRGIRIEVKDDVLISDIKELIDIKVNT